MLSKKCEHCGVIFYKDYNRSVKSFAGAMYCSNICKVYKQKNFLGYWKGKKHPELLKTGSVKTMFKKGHKTWNKGKFGKESIGYKHGMVNTSFYGRWRAINQRCKNQKTKQYKDYGGRGIKNEWQSFDKFKDDMHKSYLTHLKKHGEKQTRIERINNDGNYNKQNCKWATCAEQMRNRRNNHMITFNGKTQCMTDWAKEIGITYNSLWKRFKKMSIEKALTCSGIEI